MWDVFMWETLMNAYKQKLAYDSLSLVVSCFRLDLHKQN